MPLSHRRDGKSTTALVGMFRTPTTKHGDCPFNLTMNGLPRNQTYEQCLAAHGRPLAGRMPPERWILKVRTSSGNARLDYLTQHVISAWLWTLDQRHGTPCQPTIVRFVCTNDQPCSGYGDRIYGVQMALWQAILTNSVLIIDWTRPVPLTEYFLPLHDELAFTDFHMCLQSMNTRRGEWRLWSLEAKPWLAQEARDTKAIIKETDFVELWRELDIVDFSANFGFLPELLLNSHLQSTLQRYSLNNNTQIYDFLYITSAMQAICTAG